MHDYAVYIIFTFKQPIFSKSYISLNADYSLLHYLLDNYIMQY